MNNIVMYANGYSTNHGCEAIVRSTAKILNARMDVYLNNLTFEKKYNTIQTADFIQTRDWHKNKFVHGACFAIRRIFHNDRPYYIYENRKTLFKVKGSSCLSAGGDNYCYGGGASRLGYINKRLNENGNKTVLWGCSVEPELLKNPSVVEDLNRYSLITARESYTYKAMTDAGITKNVRLVPDPAFVLDYKEMPLPVGFCKGNTVGINISPLIIRRESHAGAVLENYSFLIQHIINNTDMQIALIPHVVTDSNDDMPVLKKLFDRFSDTKRVVMINDCGCMELKWYIKNCRFFVTARTHASIAAYSTCVPTLVVGYSVKAMGIAADIFGSCEDYVVSVQNMKCCSDLTQAFGLLVKNENSIRAHLNEFMPSYSKKALLAANYIREMWENN